MASNDHFSNDDSAITRREVICGLALAATVGGTAGFAASASAVTSKANDKVRAVLDTLEKDGPEIGLQVEIGRAHV